MSYVYLLHFAEGLPITGNRVAQHYIGFSSTDLTLRQRLDHHRAGRGSRLVAAVSAQGIDWTVARVWQDGSRTFERTLKKRRNARLMCPICAAERGTGGYMEVWPAWRLPRATRKELEVVRAGLAWLRDRQRTAAAAQALLVSLTVPYVVGADTIELRAA